MGVSNRDGWEWAADKLEVFMVAHEDDCQLFMGDVAMGDFALHAIQSRTRTVFVYLTAGDAGRPAPYREAREQGALASVNPNVRVRIHSTDPDKRPKAAGHRARFSARYLTLGCVSKIGRAHV